MVKRNGWKNKGKSDCSWGRGSEPRILRETPCVAPRHASSTTSSVLANDVLRGWWKQVPGPRFGADHPRPGSTGPRHVTTSNPDRLDRNTYHRPNGLMTVHYESNLRTQFRDQ
jgi:hypothetical protein